MRDVKLTREVFLKQVYVFVAMVSGGSSLPSFSHGEGFKKKLGETDDFYRSIWEKKLAGLMTSLFKFT